MPLTTVTENPGQSAAIVLAFAAGVAVGANWPKIRKSLAPFMAVAGDKVGDIYSVMAQAVGEQKEAIEDRGAERRHRRRTKAPTGGEQELLASLAAALLQGSKRAATKPTRKRSTRPRKASVPPTPVVADGNR